MIALALLAAAALSCGAVSRPGVAEFGADGVWRGRAVEACRTVAEAVAGKGAPIAFHGYDTLAALDRAGDDRIAFVAPGELAAGLVAGPTIAVGRQVLVVVPSSPSRTPGDLVGQPVCFIIGTRADDALAALPVERRGFQEPDEMADGLTSGRCAALAVDAEDTVEPPHRVLAPAIAAVRIVAATPAADPGWTARVAAILGAAR